MSDRVTNINDRNVCITTIIYVWISKVREISYRLYILLRRLFINENLMVKLNLYLFKNNKYMYDFSIDIKYLDLTIV